MPVSDEFPHRWHITIPDNPVTSPVSLGGGEQHTIRAIQLTALGLYFANAGFDIVPLPVHSMGFIARHRNPHAMLLLELRPRPLSVPYTVTEI
jgi:hypothetical protein